MEASPTLLEHTEGSRRNLRYSRILSLKRCGPEPLYYQVAKNMKKAVESGTIARGTKLPNEKDMARELKMAVSTLRQAWDYLEREGIIARRKKTGTFIL
jgi:DNA-binding GntR family transcriptional regulator